MTYGTLGIGGSYYNDPYLMALMQSYNPSFRASAPASAAAADSTASAVQAPLTTPAVTTQTSAAASSDGDKDDSNTALLVGGALAVAAATGACIYAAKRGNGKGMIEGFKNIWQDVKGLSSKLVNGAEGKKTTRFTVIKNADGSVQFLVPGKNTTVKGDEITNFAEKYGINLKNLFGLKSGGKTTVNSGIFKIDGNTVSFKDGKITEVKNAAGDVLEKFVGNTSELAGDDKVFLTRMDDFIKEIVKNPKIRKDGLIEANITRQIGDDILTGVYKYKEKPSLQSLTTIARLEKNDPAVKNFLLKNPKIDKIVKSKDFVENGKILMGKTPESVIFKFNDRDFVMNNGELQGFYETVNGKSIFRKNGSDEFGAYIYDNSEALTKCYKDLFKDGVVPQGVAVRVAL